MWELCRCSCFRSISTWSYSCFAEWNIMLFLCQRILHASIEPVPTCIFVLLNSSLDLCMSSTCRPHVIHMSSTCPWISQFSNSARLRGWGEVAKSHFHGDSEATLRYATPFLALFSCMTHQPCRRSGCNGDESGDAMMPWFQSWDASGFIRIPAAWLISRLGSMGLTCLTCRSDEACGISRIVHEIKSDLSRIAGDQFTNWQCFEWPMWPILTNLLHRFQSSRSIAPCSMCLWHTHKCPGRLSSRTKDWVNF